MNQSISYCCVSRILAVVAVASLSLFCSGCSTMTSMTDQTLPVETVSANGSYSVEMHPTIGAPKQYKGSLTGNTTVSEALEKSGAIKKFRSMDVEILRVVEHEGRSRGLRMPVEYETRSRGPAAHQDYALLDGDRVVVKPRNSGSLLKMLGNAVGGPK